MRYDSNTTVDFLTEGPCQIGWSRDHDHPSNAKQGVGAESSEFDYAPTSFKGHASNLHKLQRQDAYTSMTSAFSFKHKELPLERLAPVAGGELSQSPVCPCRIITIHSSQSGS